MALNVISNFAANVAHRNLVVSDRDATTSLAKLSSGQRVVSAKDDAASLAIGSRLNAEVQAMIQANVNAIQATSMLQVADGAMSKVSDILVRMKTLAVQAGSGQLSSVERGMLDTEYQALLSEVDRIALDTEFNGVTMVSGSASTATSLNGQSAANNLVEAADGFQTIAFDAGVTSSGSPNAVFTFSYSSSDNVLTANNLTAGTSQGIDVGSAAIATNTTQAINFDQLGVVVTLNSAFDKSLDIAPSSATTFTSDSAGQIETSTVTVNAAASQGVALTSNAATIDASTGGAAAAVLTLGAYTGSADLSSTGTKSIVMSDGTNNAFTVGVNVTTAFTTDDNAATLAIGDLGTLVLGTFGTSNTSFSFKLGTGNVVDVDTLTITVDSITSQSLSLAGTAVATVSQADAASTAVTTAIDTLNVARANIGASQNRLDFASQNLSIAIENAEAARSNLLDLDIAQEMTTFTSKQILVQTGVAMLAQANQLPQNLLRLFQ